MKEGLNQLLSRMSVQAREFFLQQVMAQAGAERRAAVTQTHKLDYLWAPVNVETFVNGREYLGTILRGNIYPKILDDLIELFAGSRAGASCDLSSDARRRMS